MLSQTYLGGVPLWASSDIEDAVDQLDLSVAFSSLTEPSANTITTWDDQGAGVYPLTDNRGATKSTGVTLIDKDMSTIESIDFDGVAANPGTTTTLWVNNLDSDKLYYGASAVSTGGGAQQMVSTTGSTVSGGASIGQFVRNGVGAASYASASAGITGTSLASNIEIYRLCAYTLDASPSNTLTLYVDGVSTGDVLTFDGSNQYANVVLNTPRSCTTRGGVTSTYAFQLGGMNITGNMNITCFWRTK